MVAAVLLLLAIVILIVVVISLGAYATYQFNQVKPWEEDVFEDVDKNK